MERGDSATNTNLKKRKHFSQGIKKGYKKYLEQVWFNKFNLWCILHVSHVSNPHNCQLKCVTETACFCYPIKSTRRTAHAIFRASGSASKLSKDACLLADYSCTSGLENKNWISAFPTQTLLQPVAKVFETLYLILASMACPWSPLLPLSKILEIQEHAQNKEEQLWMEGRREVRWVSYCTVVWLAEI